MLEKVNTGTLISAVGNIELKAATYTVMPPDELLGTSEIKHRVEALEEVGNVRDTQRSVYQNYCESSYIQIGLVAKEHVGAFNYVKYEKIPEPRALAMAGVMLDFSAQVPLSLRQIWTATVTPDIDNKGAQAAVRGPHGRLGILSVLASTEVPVAQSYILDKYEMDSSAAGYHLEDLKRLGIIDYRTTQFHKVDPLYSTGPVREAYGPTQAKIIDILSDSDGMPRSELIKRLGRYANKKSAQSAMDEITKKMIAIGNLTVVGDVKRDNFSEARLKNEWRDSIKELLNQVVAIEDNNTKTTNRWMHRGEAIVHDPPLLTELVRKGFDKSRVSQVRSGLEDPLADKIQTFLKNHGPATTEEVVEALGSEKVNHRSIYSALHTMQRGKSVLHPSGNKSLWQTQSISVPS